MFPSSEDEFAAISDSRHNPIYPNYIMPPMSAAKLVRKLTRSVRRMLGEEQSFGLGQLDWKLKPYLDFRGGTFVEAGANDGLNQSNTRYFELYRGWSGLLVEPIPELAQRCRRNRRGCAVENCALVASDYSETTVPMTFCNLMSVVQGGMKSASEEARHVGVGCEIQDVKSYEIAVPARTLTNVLLSHGILQFDFLSLDVEGYELQALRGLDLDRFQPKWLLIEARYRDEIESHLHPMYEPVAELSVHDVLYRRVARC